MPALQLCTCQHCDWLRCKICRIITKFVGYLPVYCARCLAVFIPTRGANVQCRILWRAVGTRVRLHSQLPRERWSRSAPSFAWDAVPHLRPDQGNYLNILYPYRNTFVFLQRAQCSHCKRCISYGSSVRCRAFNCLSSGINILEGGRPLPPEILPLSDLPSPVNGILWEMSELITHERIDVGSSNLVEGLTTWPAMYDHWPKSKGQRSRSQGHVTYQQQ